jgi:ubiquinone/menaquinone biosynthesis C-methylase UbiE
MKHQVAGVDSLVETFLKEFHAERPGLTATILSELPVVSLDGAYSSSYHALLSQLPARLSNAAILDLACGDGYLLSLIAERSDSSCSLEGVDMSAAEIHRAQLRLGSRATLSLGKAQALTSESNTFNFVVCHLALMLMDRPQDVLSEIKRVLKPEGTLSAVVGAEQDANSVSACFRSVLANHEILSKYAGLKFGDRRFGTEAGIRELLLPEFQSVRFQDLTIRRYLDGEGVWEWLSGMYNLYLFDQSRRDAIRQDFLKALTPLCDDIGKVVLSERFRLFVANV